MEFLNLTAGERIDLTDLQFATRDSQLGCVRALPQNVLTAPTKQQMWVVRGFAMSNPTGQTLQVANGTAILALRDGTRILQGVIAADGQDSSAVDLSSYAGATYGIYVRFILTPEANDTRVFWREAAGGQEYSQSVSTRVKGAWELDVAPAIPGAEWLQIGQVTTPSMAIVDQRPMYFEGRLDQATASGWGAAADRSDDRATAGVTDLQTALAALRQGLEDVKGAGIARWYSPFVAGQTIGYAGQAVLGQTSWGDAGFYAKGDTARPRLNWATDGAHLSYNRPTALMSATGPTLADAAASVATAFALRSGADEAIVRGAFYRAKAGAGSAGIDASWSRGAPGAATGGVGFYASQGIMAGQGVGLGFGLGAQAPALFVNSSNLVGIGMPSAAAMAGDTNITLQLASASGQKRFMSMMDGASAVAAFGIINNAVPSSGSTTYYGGVLSMPQGSPLLFLQGGRDYAQLANGAWMFGKGSLTSPVTGAMVNIVDSPTVVSSTSDSVSFGTISYYAQTAALQLNNNNAPASIYAQNYLFTRLTFASGTVPAFHVDANYSQFIIRDVANSVDLMNYSGTSKIATYTGPVKANYFAATSGSTSSFAFTPAVTHRDYYMGVEASIQAGSPQPGANSSYLVINSVSNTAQITFRVKAMTGQQVNTWGGMLVSNTSNNVAITSKFVRYDVNGDGDNVLSSELRNNSTNVGYNYPFGPQTANQLHNETCSPANCWAIVVSMTSSAAFQLVFKYVYVDFITPNINPQRQ